MVEEDSSPLGHYWSTSIYIRKTISNKIIHGNGCAYGLIYSFS
jgi:hypothetical protein